MRAAVYDRYGGPDALAVRDVPVPRPEAGEVLVRVEAVGLNSWDWDLIVGNPLGRLGAPFRPAHPILGADVAGVVEAVADDVTSLAVGDAVAGDLSEAGWGGLAEYVAAPASAFAGIPAGVTFEEAAAVPQAGCLALQSLRKRRPVIPGDSILINGAGGGVGSFAIQLAKRMGATVTAVDSSAKLELMRELGADEALDYVPVDFASLGRRWDRIVDPVAKRPLSAFRRCLTDTGTLVVVGGRIPTLLQLALVGPVLSKPDGHDFGLLLYSANASDTAELLQMCASGDLRVAIDGVYSLEETGAALRRIGEGRVLGKVVVRVAA